MCWQIVTHRLKGNKFAPKHACRLGTNGGFVQHIDSFFAESVALPSLETHSVKTMKTSAPVKKIFLQQSAVF